MGVIKLFTPRSGRRVFFLANLMVILAFVLSSCGGDATPTAVTTAPTATTASQTNPEPTATTAAQTNPEPTATSGDVANPGSGQETTNKLVDPQFTIPTSFSQAPMLDDLVKSGKLPDVKDRLPKDLYVVTPVEGIGQYGGTWHEVIQDASDGGSMKMEVAYEPPIRWKPDYTGYETGLAKEVDWSEDGKVITYHFREGLKWSDGEPFTTADIKFWWDDLVHSGEKLWSVPGWGYNADNSEVKMEFPDDYTWKLTFAEARWITPYVLSQGFWEWSDPGNPLKPKHYLEQFLPKNGGDYKTLQDKSKWWQNPDAPTVFAWHTTAYEPSKRIVLERNPYYWKVDPEGHQLPYIDRMEVEEVADPEVRVLNLAQGKYDASFRGSDDPNQIPLLAEKATASGYHIADGWMNGGGGWPSWIINQTYHASKDPTVANDATADEIKALLRDSNFRQGISFALDRDRVVQTAWSGIGTPQQGTISPQSWHFQSPEGQQVLKDWAASFVGPGGKADTGQAEKLLDQAMGPKGSDGWRTLKSGKPFQLIISLTDWGGKAVATAAAQTLEDNLKAVGINTITQNLIGSPDQGPLFDNGAYMLRSSHESEVDLMTFPSWVFPVDKDRSWPLTGRYFQTAGKEGQKPEAGSVEERLQAIYREMLSTPDLAGRQKLILDAIKIHIAEGPFVLGAAGDQPLPVIVKDNFHGVQKNGLLGPWAPGSPGNTHPEQFWISQ